MTDSRSELNYLTQKGTNYLDEGTSSSRGRGDKGERSICSGNKYIVHHEGRKRKMELNKRTSSSWEKERISHLESYWSALKGKKELV